MLLFHLLTVAIKIKLHSLVLRVTNNTVLINNLKKKNSITSFSWTLTDAAMLTFFNCSWNVCSFEHFQANKSCKWQKRQSTVISLKVMYVSPIFQQERMRIKWLTLASALATLAQSECESQVQIKRSFYDMERETYLEGIRCHKS